MIIVDRPPNFEQIHAAFPDADKPGVLFAYGRSIYNPSGGPVPLALLVHEATHLGRQSSPEKWWHRYIEDSEFRYNEELLAHAAEFRQLRYEDRNSGAALLMRTALRLIAPLYNYQPPRSLQQALKDLKQEIGR